MVPRAAARATARRRRRRLTSLAVASRHKSAAAAPQRSRQVDEHLAGYAGLNQVVGLGDLREPEAQWWLRLQRAVRHGRGHATRGLGAPTLAIAKAAGVSNGSLFVCFEKKAALVNELYVALKTEMGAAAVHGLPRGLRQAS